MQKKNNENEKLAKIFAFDNHSLISTVYLGGGGGLSLKVQ
jgi:hypothetical protein